jgi:hypothetical protein
LKERIATRVREAFGELPGLAEMFVGTIHAFALELLKNHKNDRDRPRLPLQGNGRRGPGPRHRLICPHLRRRPGH